MKESGITSRVVFRFEKFVEQSVNLEQPLARDADAVATVGEESPFLEGRKRRGELDARVAAELPGVMLRKFTNQRSWIINSVSHPAFLFHLQPVH